MWSMTEQNNNERQSSLHNNPNDIRIEILETIPSASPNQHAATEFSATYNVPQRISTMLNQAREQFIRVQPLVQTSQYNRNFRSWVTHPNQAFTNNIGIRPNTSQHIINVDQSLLNRLENSSSNEERLQSTRPERPILDRVAALTRNDPPSLNLETPTRQRQRQQIEEEGGISEVIAQTSPDLRRIILLFARYLPITCILLVKSLFDHFQDAFNAISLICWFIYVNSSLIQQITQNEQRRKYWTYLRDMGLLCIYFFFRFYIRDRPNTYYNLFLIRSLPDHITLSQLLWSVFITDLMLKIFTVMVKYSITMLPSTALHPRRRGRFYALIESISQLYRSLAPIQIWVNYLIEANKVNGLLFSSAYLVTKFFFDLLERIKFFKTALNAFSNKVIHGTFPTKEDLEKSEGHCPICHEAYDTPIKLACGHIFCELCIETWFCREQSCPMCRAKVAEAPLWLDGSTSHFVQIC